MAKDVIEIGVKTDKEAIRSFKQELKGAVGEAQILAVELARLNEIDAPASQIQAVESALQAATKRASDFKDSIDDANERIGVMTAGSGFERMSNSLGDIGGKIASLDFGGAAESAQRLVTISKSITFKEASAGLMDLGKTFLNLGKALLTNPLFLIAAVIAGIVAAVIALMDKLGFLEAITEAIGAVFEWFGDILDSIGDQIWALVEGLDAMAAAERKVAREMNEDMDKMTDKLKERGEIRGKEFDRQIKLAESEGKSTKELEREKLRLIGATILAERTALQVKLKNAEKYNLMTTEELADLKKKINETNSAYKDAVIDIKVFDNKNDAEAQAKAKADAEDRKAKAQARKADREREAREQLQLARQTEDILLSIKKDGEDKDVELTNVKFDRLVADNKKNTELVKALELQRQNELDGIKDKYDQKEIDKEKAFRAQLAEVRKGAEGLTEVEKLEIEKQEKLAKLREMAGEEKDLSVELRKEYLDAIAQIDADYAQKTKEAEQKIADEKKAADDKRDAEKLASDLALIESDKQIRDAKIAIANDVANGLGAIGNAFIKDQKKLEQFNKASALVQIGIDTARAISALVAASQANPLNGPTAGIAGAAQFASGIVQIVTNIAKAKQILSGSGSPSPSTGSNPDSVAPGTSSTQTVTSSGGASPSFNLFGTAGNFNNNNSTPNNGSTQQSQNMNISISVDEINRVQGNVARIQEGATL